MSGYQKQKSMQKITKKKEEKMKREKLRREI
jgi:hypothetical protein